jgi:hypothetical protein
VSRLDPKTGHEHTEGELCTFEQAKNHRYVAQMFVHIMEHPTHPIWATSAIHHGIEPWLQRLRRTNFVCIHSFQEADVLTNVVQISYAKEITVYLIAHGLEHCQHVAKQSSIFDELWENIFDNALQVRSKVLSLSLCLALGWSLRDGPDIRMIIEDRHPLLLPLLNLPGDTDCPESQLEELGRRLRNQNPWWNPREQLLLHFLDRRVVLDSTYDDSILLLAIDRGSVATVRFILCGTYHHHGAQAVLDMLKFPDVARGRRAESIPFLFALKQQGKEILEILLEYEAKSMRELHQDSSSFGQWSFSFSTASWCAVWCICYAIIRLDEDTLCGLLKAFPPRNINWQDKFGLSALHVAVHKGSRRLVQQLIEIHKATVDIPDNEGKTPAYHATILKQHECLEYFKSSGANLSFDPADMEECVVRRSLPTKLSDEDIAIVPLTEEDTEGEDTEDEDTEDEDTEDDHISDDAIADEDTN